MLPRWMFWFFCLFFVVFFGVCVVVFFFFCGVLFLFVLLGVGFLFVFKSFNKALDSKRRSDEGVKNRDASSCLVVTTYHINFLVKFLQS